MTDGKVYHIVKVSFQGEFGVVFQLYGVKYTITSSYGNFNLER